MTLPRDPDARAAFLRELVRRYAGGESTAQLGMAFAEDSSTISRWLRKAGATMRSRGAPRSVHRCNQPKVATAIRRYLDGETSVAIGRDLGVSHETVLLWVRQAGHPTRKRGCRPLREVSP